MTEKKDEITQILEKRFRQLSEIKEKHLTEITVIFDSLHQEMDNILTEEQKERFERQIDKFSSRMIQSRIDRLAALLHLDDNQIRKIETIYEKYEKEFRNRFKKPFKDHFRDMKDIKELLDKLHQEVEAILTPEQRDKYNDIRLEMRPPFHFDDHPSGRRPRPDPLFNPPPNFE